VQVQLAIAGLPAPDFALAGHSSHTSAWIAPSPVENLPCKHSEHALEPLTSLYVPATHATHANPSGPVYPMLHVQLVMSLLPLPEYVCAGQALHVASDVSPVSVLYLPCRHREQGAEPLSALYDPALQALQTDVPSGPEYPALQIHLVMFPLPLGEFDCGVHDRHSISDVCALISLYLPRPHSTHANEPRTALYVPGLHAEHARPSVPVYPTLHVQFVMRLLACCASVFDGHSKHPVSVSSPLVLLYLPIAHASQSSADVIPVPL